MQEAACYPDHAKVKVLNVDVDTCSSLHTETHIAETTFCNVVVHVTYLLKFLVLYGFLKYKP